MSVNHGVRNSKEDVWLGIDLGTQSVKAMAVAADGFIVANASYPLRSKRVDREHTQDPESWWRAVVHCCRHIAQTVDVAAMRGLAIDATSGTVLLTDNHLNPASDALMYDDSRAIAEADEVNDVGIALWNDLGYSIQPSWALPKLLWLARHRNLGSLKNFKLTHQNDFIHQRLAGRRVATDWSHSLKSGYDLLRLCWPVQIFESLGLGSFLFPDVVGPGSLIAHVSVEASETTGLPAGLPIFAGMTDGCAAQIASGTVENGSWNSVIGTTLVLKGVTAERVVDPLGVVYSHRTKAGNWLPGGASSTGAGIITKRLPDADLASLSLQAARRGPTKLLMYPLASRGERFPFRAEAAQGFTVGTPQDSVEEYRAIIQGISFVERLAFDYLEMLGAPMYGKFTISGGAVRSSLWNSLRASILERPLTIPDVTESAFGMAVLASAGGSNLTDAAKRMVQAGTVVDPIDDFATTYGESYENLLLALRERGWLQPDIAHYAIAKLRSRKGGRP